MRKIFVIALAALAPLGLGAQTKDLKIEVLFKNAPAGAKYVLRSVDMQAGFADTVSLKKNGEKALFKQAFAEPGYLSLSYIAPEGSTPVRESFTLFVDAPATIKVSGDQVENLPAASVQGGVEDDPLLQRIQPKNAALYDTFRQYQAAAQVADNRPAVEALIEKLNQMSAEISSLKREYIAARPQSVYSAALLAGMLREDPKTIEPLFAGLSQEVKDSRYGKTVADKLALIQAIQPGQPAPRFRPDGHRRQHHPPVGLPRTVGAAGLLGIVVRMVPPGESRFGGTVRQIRRQGFRDHRSGRARQG